MVGARCPSPCGNARRILPGPPDRKDAGPVRRSRAIGAPRGTRSAGPGIRGREGNRHACRCEVFLRQRRRHREGGQPVLPNCHRAGQTGNAGPDVDNVGVHDRSLSLAVLSDDDCVDERPLKPVGRNASELGNACRRRRTNKAFFGVIFSFGETETSVNVMRRYHLLPILMFLTGLAVGVLAAGGYGKPHEPAAPPEAQDVADGLDAPDEAESTSISTGKVACNCCLVSENRGVGDRRRRPLRKRA